MHNRLFFLRDFCIFIDKTKNLENLLYNININENYNKSLFIDTYKINILEVSFIS